ncbi:hypothetical protein [Pseudomonas sp. DWP1b1]|uniref:hypothetical protein n=1 Tax=unclassified Pseudomonas TaxID=196821 RepID=UPI003CFA77AF
MRTTTINNLHSRRTWLTKVLSGESLPSKEEFRALSTMKSFCLLEIPGLFKRISLNSLKQAAKSSMLDIPVSNMWSEMLEMRAKAFALSTPTVIEAPTPSLPTFKEQARIALLEAHIASMAYFDVLTFLERIDPQSSHSAEEIRAYIALKVKTSKVKYHSFLTSDLMISSKNIKVIDGGKKNG